MTGDVEPKRTKVFLCFPAREGTVTADYLPWLNTMLRWSHNEDPNFPFVFTKVGTIKGCEPVEYCRNRMVEDFLTTDAEVLWTVDSDMVPFEYSHRVLFGLADVSAGPCPMFSKVGPVKACRPNVFGGNLVEEQTWAWLGDEPAVACGTANMAVKRCVFENPEMLTAQGGWFQKRYGDKGSVTMGEDVDFCIRAQKAGHSFCVVAEAQMGHIKPLDMDEVFKCVSDQVIQLNELDQKAKAAEVA